LAKLTDRTFTVFSRECIRPDMMILFIICHPRGLRPPSLLARVRLLQIPQEVPGRAGIKEWGVTVQLPIFNERYVMERLVEASRA